MKITARGHVCFNFTLLMFFRTIWIALRGPDLKERNFSKNKNQNIPFLISFS